MRGFRALFGVIPLYRIKVKRICAGDVNRVGRPGVKKRTVPNKSRNRPTPRKFKGITQNVRF